MKCLRYALFCFTASITLLNAQDHQYGLRKGSRLMRIARAICSSVPSPNILVGALLLSARATHGLRDYYTIRETDARIKTVQRALDEHTLVNRCIGGMQCNGLSHSDQDGWHSTCQSSDIRCFELFSDSGSFLSVVHVLANGDRMANYCGPIGTTKQGDLYADCREWDFFTGGRLSKSQQPKRLHALLVNFKQHPDNWYEQFKLRQKEYAVGFSAEEEPLMLAAAKRSLRSTVETLSDAEFWQLNGQEQAPKADFNDESGPHYSDWGYRDLLDNPWGLAKALYPHDANKMLRSAVVIVLKELGYSHTILRSIEVRRLMVDALSHQPHGKCNDSRLNAHPEVDKPGWFGMTTSSTANPVMKRLELVLREIVK